MDYSLAVNNTDINELKSKIDAQKKINEYAQLKKDLFNVTFQANNALTEFDGGMQQIDTEKSLKTKRENRHYQKFLSHERLKCVM